MVFAKQKYIDMWHKMFNFVLKIKVIGSNTNGTKFSRTSGLIMPASVGKMLVVCIKMYRSKYIS